LRTFDGVNAEGGPPNRPRLRYRLQTVRSAPTDTCTALGSKSGSTVLKPNNDKHYRKASKNGLRHRHSEPRRGLAVRGP